jgi:MerR family copper efflux transcriptional regulator
MTDRSSDGSTHALLQIGEVAEQIGLSLRTVRYYEEVGLVSPSARSEGGFRLYSDEDVSRLALVKRMKPLGLTLEEMGELVTLIEDGGRADALAEADLRQVVEGLRDYAARSDTAIERFDRDLTQARQLRVRIGEQLGRCEMLLEQRGNT